MPKRFIFQEPDNELPRFECDLESKQCTGHARTGLRCRRKTVIGLPYCWSHLQSERKIRILPSLIPNAGKGIFAQDKTKAANEVVFRKNDIILEYTGELINKFTLNRRYGKYTAPYGVQISHDRFEDGACERGAGTLGNHSASQANAKLVTSKVGNLHRVFIQASKDIQNGKEILMHYGKDYRMDEGTFFTTKAASKPKGRIYRI
jgi:hypothetical protein